MWSDPLCSPHFRRLLLAVLRCCSVDSTGKIWRSTQDAHKDTEGTSCCFTFTRMCCMECSKPWVITFCNEIYEHLFFSLSVPSPNLWESCCLHNSQMAHLPPKISRGCKAGEETTQEKHFSFKTSSSCCAGKRREREMWWQEQEIEIQCGAHSEQGPVMNDIHELTASLELGVCLAGRCITECINKKKIKKFFMPSVLAEVWKSGGILCCKYLCSSSLCTPLTGRALG